MKLFVQVMDDDGKVLAEHSADPCQPSCWKAPTGQRFVGKMPQQSSDVVNNGTYELFGITFQPHLRVDRPNGWSTPPPPPSNIPTNLPVGFPNYKPLTKSSFLWSKAAPTPTPKQNSVADSPDCGNIKRII